MHKFMAEYLSEIKTFCDQLDSIGSRILEHENIYGVWMDYGMNMNLVYLHCY